MTSNRSIDTDPQQQEAASPLMLVVRSSSRYAAFMSRATHNTAKVGSLAAVVGWLIVPAYSWSAALVPELAEPTKIEERCDRAKNPSCPSNGILQLSLPLPVGGRCASIPYPKEVRESAVHRAIVVQLAIDEDGDLFASRLLDGTDSANLDRHAHDAARNCRFTAGTANDVPAKLTVKLRYAWDPSADAFDPPEQLAARAARPLTDKSKPPTYTVKCDYSNLSVPRTVLMDQKFTRAVVRVYGTIFESLGTVQAIEVASSSGFPDLDSIAVYAMRKARCLVSGVLPTEGAHVAQEFSFRR
jgi:TonB family protein